MAHQLCKAATIGRDYWTPSRARLKHNHRAILLAERRNHQGTGPIHESSNLVPIPGPQITDHAIAVGVLNISLQRTLAHDYNLDLRCNPPCSSKKHFNALRLLEATNEQCHRSASL